MFHHFHDADHAAGDGAISGEQFAAIIEHVGRQNILGAQEWAEKYRRNDLREGQCCITFDDNLRCQHDVALPVLKEYGLTALWFICSLPLRGEPLPLEVYRHYRTVCFPTTQAFYDHFFEALSQSEFADLYEEGRKTFDPETYLAIYKFYTLDDRLFRYVRDRVLGQSRYYAFMNRLIATSGLDPDHLLNHLWMDSGALKELADDGHLIGLHSHHHPTALADLSVQDQRREYETNKEILEDISGAPVSIASHPNNSYSTDTLEILADMGISLAFCSNMTIGPVAGPLQIPREDHTNILREMTDSV
ncbi:MAG TPA: polysaccharide deacetylase [Rhodospirillaceae bacterium]|nr:polysaccharide deacetylase [Rhodospirillaceae bacterium]|tara:strand:+ start:9204 stop:10118 length:915 start_codon:yes stop_codon:yes gene_type:complete